LLWLAVAAAEMEGHKKVVEVVRAAIGLLLLENLLEEAHLLKVFLLSQQAKHTLY
jgi:hypothetical protein